MKKSGLTTKPKAFKQPSHVAMSHPSRNLGRFLHPVRRGKVTTAPKENLSKMTEKPANMQGMDASDTNSEAIGSLLGPRDESYTPPAFKTKKAKTSQAIPFFGSM